MVKDVSIKFSWDIHWNQRFVRVVLNLIEFFIFILNQFSLNHGERVGVGVGVGVLEDDNLSDGMILSKEDILKMIK